MTATTSPPPFPKVLLIGGAVMIVLAIVAAATSSWTGTGASKTTMPTAILEWRDIIITDRADGAVVINDVGDASGKPDVLPPGSSGFVRVAVSGLAVTRHMHGIGKEPPFKLLREVNDRMWLFDPSTGNRVDLNAFGPQNRAVFAQLLPSARAAASAAMAGAVSGKVAP